MLRPVGLALRGGLFTTGRSPHTVIPFYISKRIAISNRIRVMPESRDRWLFAITLASAAAVLVSIAAAETLLAMAALGWLLVRPGPIVWPSYSLPLAAFMITTVVSLV